MLVRIDPSIVALLRKSSMSASDQTAIEAEIDRIAKARNCTTQQAAELIHFTANPEAC